MTIRTLQNRGARNQPLRKSETSFGWNIDCYEGCELGCCCYAWWLKSYYQWERTNQWMPYQHWVNARPIQNFGDDLRF